MSVRLLPVFVCFFLILPVFGTSFDAADVTETRVYPFVKRQALGRFDGKHLTEDAFKKSLNSGSVSDALRCTEFCAAMLVNSIFYETKLNRVVTLMSPENITGEMDTQVMTKALDNTNGVSKYGKIPASRDVLQKLALFAPESLSYCDWLSRCCALVGTANNYELSRFNENYTLEEALYIIFMRPSFSFWEKNDKFLYVQFLCGAMRTYMHIVDSVEVSPCSGRKSYVAILLRCFDIYYKENKKNR